MNNIFKDDFTKIIRNFNRSNNEEVKEASAYSFVQVQYLAEYIYPLASIPSLTPEMEAYAYSFITKYYKSWKYLGKEILNNLDLLENIYLEVLNELNKFAINRTEYSRNLEDINLDMYNDFYKNYPDFLKLYNKILSSNHLFFGDGDKNSCAYYFPSIKEDAIFVNLEKNFDVLCAIPHEMGHIYQFHIDYYDHRLGDNFLTEFTSTLMEYLFIDYYQGIDEKICKQMHIRMLYANKYLLLEALSQIELFKRYPNAIEDKQIKDKYLDELSEIYNEYYKNNMDDDYYGEFMINEIYVHFYAIGFMLAMSYFYPVKYGIDFNEIDKLYIQNNKTNNLNDLLTQVDMEAIKQYLRDYLPKKNNKRIKKEL